jgi:hypothetical protein
MTTGRESGEVVYWHHELPPLQSDVMGEHTVEAASRRVPGTIVRGDQVWDSCLADLKTQVRSRLQQEMVRLGGDYAHVLNESVDSRHDAATGEAWLHGLFTYVLLRRTPD